jgi:cytochrome c oxidase subunit 2
MGPTLPLFPEQASTMAPRVDALYFYLLAVSAFFSLVIAILVIVFAIKYRRRAQDDLPRPIEGSTGSEIVVRHPVGIALTFFF